MTVDGVLTDLGATPPPDATVAFVRRDAPEALDLIRHTAAHLLAHAVKELYPGTAVAIGPVIEDGFYYDFAREHPFTPDDLTRIEARMTAIVDRAEAIEREVRDRASAIALFTAAGEGFKAELLSAIPDGEPISLYRQGDFFDLCRGPHLPSTAHVSKAFKLLKVAGAYWRGDSRNPMLQRIYGTAWRSEEELEDYLRRREEAERRDHRRLGREMDLFHFQEEAPGAVFWHPRGWTLFQTLVEHLRRRQRAAGYVEVNTPDIMDRSLWEASGHWDKFGDNMFVTEAREDRVYALKPMSCPGGVQIFRQGTKSYRDLPARIAEFGKVHRYEPSGALHGLLRVRAFTQDDAHIFCTEEQVTAECAAVCDLVLGIYRDFGFEDVSVRFSDRPERRIGDDTVWDIAEAALKEAALATGLSFTHNPGEGAFYGPKLEFVLRDALGRSWQCGTIQVDLTLPERLGASYVDSDGRKRVPVMLHRAIFGSLERFIGILLEQHAGRLPLWLAPLKVVVATVTDAAWGYARTVLDTLSAAGIAAEADFRNEKIGYKVRAHSVARIPLLFVVGEREAADGTVAIRRLGGRNTETPSLDDAIRRIVAEATPPAVPHPQTEGWTAR